MRPPGENEINRYYQVFQDLSLKTEYLIGYEGNKFSTTGNVREDILAITSVHPMREEALLEFLHQYDKSISFIEEMVDEGLMIRSGYRGSRYFLRKLRSN